MLVKKIENQVRETPDNIAVKTLHKQLTYNELNNMANHIAYKLLEISQQIDKTEEQAAAALLFEQGYGMIAGTLGALKANMIYVPFSTDYPENRLLYMLKNSGAQIIVTNELNVVLAESLRRASENELYILDIDTLDYSVEARNPELPLPEAEKAYILYTSGSTGVPKGILQSRKNVYYYASSYSKCISLTPHDRMTLFSSFSHDAAVIDIFSGLLNGACLYPVNLREQPSMDKLADWLVDERITVWHSVPTFYRIFANALTEGKAFPDLRYIVLGGENVLLNDVILAKKYFPDAYFMNLYGQSEASFNSYHIIQPHETVEKITIGKPIDGTLLLVVDKDGVEVEPLKTGEIVVASNHIALGYWKDEEKTNSSFSVDEELGRLYWTGDIGRLILDGSIEYVGRKDFQMKIRGYRVEAAEVENRLLAYKSITEAAVIGKSNENNDIILMAYYSASEKINKNSLRDYLLIELPEYMVPSQLIQLNELPRTPNGKTDKQAMLEIAVCEEPETEEAEFRNETERKIAEIWRSILGTDKVSRGENFFDAGGNSMMLILFQTKLDQLFPGKVTVKDLFLYTTIEKLADYIMTQQSEDTEALEVKFAELPPEYFGSDGSKELAGEFCINLEGDTYNNLKEICTKEGVEINTALLAIFSYVLFESSKKSSISIQTLLQDSNRIIPIDVELPGSINVSQLFRWFNSKTETLEAPKAYNINKIENLFIKKGNNQILPLFYDKKLLSSAAGKTDIYDILFGVSAGLEQCSCTLEFNDRRLRKEKMKDMLKSVAKIIKLLERNET